MKSNKKKKCQPQSRLFLFQEGEGKQKWQCRLHSYSHVLSQKFRSRSFSGTTATWGRRGGVLSPWKHPPWSTTRVGVSTRDKKNQWKGPVFDTFFFFFSFFLNIFLKCRFWVGGGCCIFSVTILISKLEVQSHRKKCLCLICQDATKDPTKKALHIYIKKFGATRLFSGSPHSLHTWVSHGSVFLWSVTWLVIYWYPQCVYRNAYFSQYWQERQGQKPCIWSWKPRFC